MAKRKKRARTQPKKRAKLRRTSTVGRTRKRGSPESKRAVKVVPRKKRQMKSLGPGTETVVVDVMEQPAPGVITITEIEETQVPLRGWVKTEGKRER